MVCLQENVQGECLENFGKNNSAVKESGGREDLLLDSPKSDSARPQEEEQTKDRSNLTRGCLHCVKPDY